MDFFSDSLARLKHYLRVSKDQEVAAALGLSKTAFSERKKRNSFPEKELCALAERRPELGIDVNYVLTGKATERAVVEMEQNMAARWKEIRGARSVEEFAQLLGTAPQVVTAIEAQEQLPTRDLLLRLVEVFPDHDALWLWGGEADELDGPITGIETILVLNYRASSPEGKAALRQAAAFHAEYNSRNRSPSSKGS